MRLRDNHHDHGRSGQPVFGRLRLDRRAERRLLVLGADFGRMRGGLPVCGPGREPLLRDSAHAMPARTSASPTATASTMHR